jgi:hypothetical protein
VAILSNRLEAASLAAMKQKRKPRTWDTGFLTGYYTADLRFGKEHLFEQISTF